MCRRHFSQIPRIFDRKVKQVQRSRAALDPESRTVDYLKDEVADRLVDRLLDIKKRFSTILDLGSGAGHIPKFVDGGLADRMIMTDFSETLLNRDIKQPYRIPVERRLVDEEAITEFKPNSIECVLSNLSLHWVNDLPGTLTQINKMLVPDGVFIGAMFGGETLYELRTSLQLAEVERDGGISPHVSPMTDVKDVANLLSRAGFSLTTVDLDEIVVNYPSMYELMNDLRSMGENNAVLNRRKYTRRDIFIAANEIYKGLIILIVELYGTNDGFPATFQIIYMVLLN